MPTSTQKSKDPQAVLACPFCKTQWEAPWSEFEPGKIHKIICPRDGCGQYLDVEAVLEVRTIADATELPEPNSSTESNNVSADIRKPTKHSWKYTQQTKYTPVDMQRVLDRFQKVHWAIGDHTLSGPGTFAINLSALGLEAFRKAVTQFRDAAQEMFEGPKFDLIPIELLPKTEWVPPDDLLKIWEESLVLRGMNDGPLSVFFWLEPPRLTDGEKTALLGLLVHFTSVGTFD
jgi:hypothetical protein